MLVATSRVYQTSCTAIRSGDEGFVVDSPIYPDELEVLPTVLEQAGFSASGLLATHGDWDHLMGRLAFPGLALGLGQPTVERLHREPGAEVVDDQAEALRERLDGDTCAVNSRHHQAPATLGKGLVASATAQTNRAVRLVVPRSRRRR